MLRLRFSAPLVALWLAWLYLLLYRSVGQETVFGIYSVRYALTLALALAVVLVITYFELQVAQKHREAFLGQLARVWKPLLILSILAYVALLWVGLEVRVRLFGTVAILSIWMLMVEYGSLPMTETSVRWIRRAGWLSLVVAVAIQVWYLNYVPVGSYHDEAAYTHIAMMALQTGRLGGDLYGFPPVHYIGFGNWVFILSAWYEIFGFGWTQGRWWAFVFGVLAVVMLTWTIHRFVHRQVALLAAVLMSSSWLFIESRSIRPDTITLFFIAASLFCFLHALQKPGFWRFALLGFVTALGLEAHLLMAVYGFTYGCVLIYGWLSDSLRARRLILPNALIAMVLGALPPLVIYFVTHLLPDRGGPSATILKSSFNLIQNIARELTRWGDHIQSTPMQFEALLLFISIFILLRFGGGRRLYLVLLVLAAVGYVVFAPNYFSHYNRYFLPLVILVIAGAFATLFERVDIRRLSVTLLLVFALGLIVFTENTRAELIAGQEIIRGVTGTFTFDRPKPATVAYIESHLPAGKTVVAQVVYYLSFEDPYRYTFFGSEYGVYAMATTRLALGGLPTEQVLDAWAPDAILLDRRWDPFEETLLEAETIYAYVQAYVEVQGLVHVDHFGSEFMLFIRPEFAGNP